MIYCAPLNPNIVLINGGPTWPSTVINRLVGQPPNAIIETIDPELSDRYLPPYPPLPPIIDMTKVEEIRRTVYLSNIDKEVTLEILHEFLSQIGEIRYIRAAYDDEDAKTRDAYVEFSEQPSIPKILSLNGFLFFNRPLYVNHATACIIKPAIVRDIRSGKNEENEKLSKSRSPSTSRRKDHGKDDSDSDRRRSSSRSKSKRLSKSKKRSRSRSSRDQKHHSRSRSRDRHRRKKHSRKRSRSKERRRRRHSDS